MKLSIAAALSHDSKLLILDEATSGLDPVSRDDILDLFLEFVQDETNSILVYSYITSDLEKWQIILFLYVRSKWYFANLVIVYRKQDYEWEVLSMIIAYPASAAIFAGAAFLLKDIALCSRVLACIGVVLYIVSWCVTRKTIAYRNVA